MTDVLFTPEEYDEAFQKCVPPRNNKLSCQMPGCTTKSFGRCRLTVTKRHHCRRCGKSICHPCSRFPDSNKHSEDRFCTECSGEVPRPRVPVTKPQLNRDSAAVGACDSGGRRLTSGEQLLANRRYRDSPVLLRLLKEIRTADP